MLYSGNNSTNAITGVGFQPDFTWFVARSDGRSRSLVDSVRGFNGTSARVIQSESTNAQWESAYINSLNSDGFTVSGSENYINNSSHTYVAWNWKAGTSVSGNSTGSGDDVAYTGSINTAAGFSIIKYGGNGTTGHQIPHRLGVVPDAIWIKNITTQSWNCWFPNTSMGGTKMMQLDNTGAASSQSWINNKMPTTSVVELEAGAATNTRDGDSNPQPYIMYSWKSIEGFSKIGEYKGNGNANGQFVHTGFAVAWVIIKPSSRTGNWFIANNKSSPNNVVDKVIFANTTAAEYTDPNADCKKDFLSNGFKIRTTDDNTNENNATYVYIAFAETPTKYSNGK